MSWWLALVAGGVLVAALLYWLLIVSEGAYLGPRVVAGLYNRVAARYDAIKQYYAEDEARFLGEPVARRLDLRQAAMPGAPDRVAPLPLLLDVACGTGRFASTVLDCYHKPCRIIGLDASAAMLAQAERKLAAAGYADQVELHHVSAPPVPYAADQFAVVACLEALEFLPDQTGVVQELLRVLEPGGLLVITNRIGRDARLLPGRAMSSEDLAARLHTAGAAAVKITLWQMDYDLLWALKDDGSPVEAAETLLYWTI